MALARVQSTGHAYASGGGNLALSFSSLPAAVAVIVVPVCMHRLSDGGASATVTDNQGNTYLESVASGYRNGLQVRIFHTYNIGAPSGTFTVTVTSAGGTQETLAEAIEYSGFGTANPLLGVASNNGNSTTPSSGTTGVTGTAEALVVTATAIAMLNFVPAITVEVVSPVWVEEFERLALGNVLSGEGDTRIVSGSGAQSCSWTLNHSTSWVAAIAAFFSDPPVSDARLTQVHRKALYAQDSTIRLTQMHRKVLYPFTCNPAPPPPPATGCPEALPDTLPVAGDPGCVADFDPDSL